MDATIKATCNEPLRQESMTLSHDAIPKSSTEQFDAPVSRLKGGCCVCTGIDALCTCPTPHGAVVLMLLR